MSNDIGAVTQEMMKNAIEYCAEKWQLGTAEKVIEARGRGDCSVCEYLYYDLAKAMAEYLGSVDDTASAVYFYNESLLPWTDQPADRPNLLPGFHLIVRTDAKGRTLSQLAASLAQAVEKESRRLPCPRATELCHTFNIALVDDHDMEERTGYAALLTSHELRPIEMWHR